MKQASMKILFVVCMAVIIGILPVSSYAATANEIDASVNASLDRFVKEVKGAQEFLDAAKGVLIMPGVIQGGLVIGAEYGEGALRIGGKTVAYYNVVSGSFGYQIGAQKKDIILVFMDDAVLEKFRNSENWRAGVDAKITVVNVGADESLNTMKFQQPVVGFVFDQKGLMAGATIEGSKFSKLKK
ncbi:MAG: YSC84-related protein [Syntrophus sp. (in: bacteria)]|nr:YSC84-related protein [Syntrophus sp. (in: bacteria)]